ncbi:MAG: glutamate--cysteine ligase [Gammaproteobacteria bacterium]|nr:glutamate--cysteine ligase [Gammaproteobacteria bacterium]
MLDPVSRLFDKRLSALAAARDPGLLNGGLRGVERECLRVTPEGFIAQTGHPESLGSALTNRYITTDYSEALLELITPAQPDIDSTAGFLRDIHQFSVSGLGDELLWPLSMPCRLRGELDIPIARYGTSNAGRFKSVYRHGLWHRYGRYMQAIAGVHFNFSLPDAYWAFQADLGRSAAPIADMKSAAYLAVVRNVRRLDWLLLYLFGASPAVCKCFLPQGKAGLDEFDDESWYAPYATSLRMSEIGYRNERKTALLVSPNSLDEYVNDLTHAIRTPHPPFEKIGVFADGEYRQLSGNLLQIEAEFYSTIRPKRSALSGERPTAALRRGGVEYVELRTLDLDPYAATGVSDTALRFSEIFLLYCLFAPSPPEYPEEQATIDHNHGLVAHRGREPGLQLQRDGVAVSMREWGLESLRDMRRVAELLDSSTGKYTAALLECEARLREPDRTPSAQLLVDIRASRMSAADFGLDLARRHKAELLALGNAGNEHYALLEVEAQASLDRQCWIEEHDTLPFEEYLAAYLA